MRYRVVSLFDGMACGMLAILKAGQEVEKYYAYEIDKYAIQTATYNFPQIIECGDVFEADFSKYKDIDFVIGGSPCTYWSIAQKNNRETEASGLGWELFSQYVRAIREIKPKFFIYENNKSMSNAIRESITETFGFEPICINSALVSAQNRQRLYWVGKRNDDSTYSKVDVQQPEDRGILLRDILDGAVKKDCKSMIAEPVACRYRGRKDKNGNGYAKYECCEDGKSNTLDTNTTNGSMVAVPTHVQKDSFPAEPICPTAQGKSHTINAGYSKLEVQNWYDRVYNSDSKKQQHDYIAETVQGASNQMNVPPSPNDENISQGFRIYDVGGKSVTLKGNAGGAGGKTGLYAIPTEFEDGVPVKAISQSNGKTYPVYTVADGKITIKGKDYPIKLQDDYYIIRKLSVAECKRLQTVPEWYEFPVSNAQAYKMLGNGWTIDVIAHIIEACLCQKPSELSIREWSAQDPIAVPNRGIKRYVPKLKFRFGK